MYATLGGGIEANDVTIPAFASFVQCTCSVVREYGGNWYTFLSSDDKLIVMFEQMKTKTRNVLLVPKLVESQFFETCIVVTYFNCPCKKKNITR